MKSIRIKQFNINNFKGIKSLKIDFGTEGNKNILGANGTGKTTLFDAFMWLLFNKDSQGRSDFEIKQLDQNNNIIHNQEVEVFAELLIDNEVIEIRKILSEKWTKKRGSDISEFTGNETTYFFNSVPLSQKEFNLKISMLIDENIFKIITNPTAFVSLKWQDQRKTLVDIAGMPSDTQIALGDDDLEELLNEIGTQKSIDEFISQTKFSIKQAKDELNNIPARIEELTRSLPVPIIEKNVIANIQNLEKELQNIDKQIEDKMLQFDSVIGKRNQNQKAIQEVQSKLNDIEFKTKEEAKTKALLKDPAVHEIDLLVNEFNDREVEINNLNSKIKTLELEISDLSKKRDSLREDWQNVNARQFELKSTDTTCNSCGQELPNAEGKRSELEFRFNFVKQDELDSINKKGGGYKAQQDLFEETLKKHNEDLIELKNTNHSCKEKIEKLRDNLKTSSYNVFDPDKFITESLLNNTEYNQLKNEISTLKSLTFETPTESLTAELKEKKQEIQSEIIKLNGYLQDNKRSVEIYKRIEELKNQESSQNQVVAKFERKLFLVEKFNKKKIDLLDETVNKMFSLVKFKLFDAQINGGIKDTCEAMVNGVPFSNVNTASKINAGIDIINTLCEFYGVTAPIFIDNKESVTEVIKTESQTIFLTVSPEDKVLKID